MIILLYYMIQIKLIFVNKYTQIFLAAIFHEIIPDSLMAKTCNFRFLTNL